MSARNAKTVLVSLLTVITLFSLMTPFAFAAESATVADTSTTTSYSNAFGDSGSTRYTGRIWTDKTVSTSSMVFTGSNSHTIDIGNSDFLVAYSALATSSTVTTETPVDVSFVLDFSASINWAVAGEEVAPGTDEEAQAASRLQAMVDSLNDAISMLAESNDHNRIAITVFNGSATQLLPLTEVSTISSELLKSGQFLEITEFQPKSGSGKREADSTVECHINDRQAETAGGTNIQSGLYEGMKLLAEVQDTTYTTNGEAVTRIPNVILMSDGAPTTFSSASDAQYVDKNGTSHTGAITNDTILNSGKTVSSGSWWDSLHTTAAIGSGDNNNPDSADGFMALMTASYWKERITDHYYSGDTSGASANVYTIGFSTDLQTDGMVEMANLVLNPAENINRSDLDNAQVRAVQTAWKNYTNGRSVTVKAPIGKGNNDTFVSYKVERPDDITIDDIGYNDAYYPAENDYELYQAFRDIIGTITSQAKLPTEHGSLDPTESGYLTYTDPIGQYLQVDEVKAILWNDTLFTKHSTQQSGDKKTTTILLRERLRIPPTRRTITSAASRSL